VEELIKLHAPEKWAASFVKELNQTKKHKSFQLDDVRSTAQYLCKSVVVAVEKRVKGHSQSRRCRCSQELEPAYTDTAYHACGDVAGTSAKKHGSTAKSELCSILNRTIREDDPIAIIHAVVFANAINMKLVGNHTPEPWLQKLFPKSHPCVNVGRNVNFSFKARVTESKERWERNTTAVTSNIIIYTGTRNSWSRDLRKRSSTSKSLFRVEPGFAAHGEVVASAMITKDFTKA
jgi:hypothetical protein